MKNYILPALALIVTTAGVTVTIDQKFNQPETRYIVREVPAACEEPVSLAPVPAPPPVVVVEDTTPNDFIAALRGEPGGNVHLRPHSAWNGDPLSSHLDHGDVVQEVNGLEVRDVDDLRLAIDKIKLADGQVTIKLSRSGTPVTVRYSI
jgi:S1-C subfamily serine protease